MKFHWTNVHPPAGNYSYCFYQGLTLHAFPEGAWKVIKDSVVVAHWEEQTTGKDINEAKQRAQAAALVQLQLLG
jgi:hypothetical protein